MRYGSSRIAILLVVLTLTLAAAPAVAAGGRALSVEGSPGLFATAWQALGELVSWLVGDPVGSGLDLYGLATSSACPGESGSMMDPDGCPRTQGSPDPGSIMDSDG